MKKHHLTLTLFFPIKYGVIADLKNMKLLFESFYKKITKASGSKMGRFCIAVPTDITEVEKRAFYDVVAKSDIKAREIKIVEKTYCRCSRITDRHEQPEGKSYSKHRGRYN